MASCHKYFSGITVISHLRLPSFRNTRSRWTRYCSTGSGNGPNNRPWGTLNRIPTIECISSSRPAVSKNGPFDPDIEALYCGNQKFRDLIAATTPNLLRDLATQGQRPPFMLLDCSDSRVGEQVIFSAEPGTLFTTGNIANQFHEHDLNSKSVLAYAVNALGVKHVIVMGHYGCGGVAAATLPPPPPATSIIDPVDDVVQPWIQPIRTIYQTSHRPEIVEHRKTKTLERAKIQALSAVDPDAATAAKKRVDALPHLHDPAFRALVEENVKANVMRIARSTVISEHYKSLPTHPKTRGVFIHGWVYDIETGEVADLGVSIGPPGKDIPITPFPTLVT